MIYIFVSFAPWIIYWSLCRVNTWLGLIIPFVISLVLVSMQVPKRDLNIMDIVSLLYFSIATICTFMLDMHIFIDKCGFLGYLALFIMSTISVAIGRPYTLQCAKRDYPRVYWRDKLFIKINSIITILWSIIFAINSIIFLVLSGHIATMLTITCIVVGIVFSILFPLKAPGFFVLRKIRKYDWRVSIDPKRPKRDNEYDIIIVGSGIGGLTCGALLAKKGYKILVLEQHFQIGGYCSSFRRRGFVFNTGVEDVSGLWEKGPVTYLLRCLGLRKEDLFVRNRVRFIINGKNIDIPDNLEELIEMLGKMFPDEKENIRSFFNDAKKAYEECYSTVEDYGVPLSAELIAKVYGVEKLRNYPLEHPHFYEWMNKTFEEKLCEYFKDEELKKLFYALLGYIGTRPEQTSASSALVACISYYLYGGYFPKGGAQRFADTLKGVIERHGGKVLVNHKVDKILVENRRVRGVKVGEKIFEAPIVVANANAKTVFLELIDREHLDKKFIDYIKNLKMSGSAFMVFLGLNIDLSKYPTLIKNIDENYEIVINSNADPDLAPEGMASVTILTGADYGDFPERGTREYQEKKRKIAEDLILKAEKVIPNLSKHIIFKDAATPKTFERYTLMPQGAIYSFDQSIKTKRPFFKTPIKGLYLASSSTFPGGGIEAVVIAGIICANDIMGWRRIH